MIKPMMILLYVENWINSYPRKAIPFSDIKSTLRMQNGETRMNLSWALAVKYGLNKLTEPIKAAVKGKFFSKKNVAKTIDN